MRDQVLASLAALMGLCPTTAVALPTTVDVVARKLGWTEERVIEELADNGELRDYLAGICREAVRSEVAR